MENRLDFQYKLKRLRDLGGEGPTSWYVRLGYFQPNQMVAIFSASVGRSYFEGKQKQLINVAETWLKRLGFDGKRLLIREETRQSDPDDYELHEVLLPIEVSFPLLIDERGGRFEFAIY